jgi:hypothetical protein
MISSHASANWGNPCKKSTSSPALEPAESESKEYPFTVRVLRPKLSSSAIDGHLHSSMPKVPQTRLFWNLAGEK